MLSDEEAVTILKECPVPKVDNNWTVMMSFCCLLNEIWSFSPMKESIKIACTAGGERAVWVIKRDESNMPGSVPESAGRITLPCGREMICHCAQNFHVMKTLLLVLQEKLYSSLYCSTKNRGSLIRSKCWSPLKILPRIITDLMAGQSVWYCYMKFVACPVVTDFLQSRYYFRLLLDLITKNICYI